MKKMICLCLVLCFFINLPVFSERRYSLEKEVLLNNQEIVFQVYYDSGNSAWTRYAGRAAVRYLKAMEEYLSVDFPARDSFEINGRETVYLNGTRVGGYNTWNEVALEYGLSKVNNPGLLFHELGHYWFWNGNIKWLYEGMVSFLPLAMIDAGVLELSVDEYNAILSHWGFFKDSLIDSPSVGKDFRTTDFTIYYMKTFRVQFLLFQELGSVKYREFAREYFYIIKNQGGFASEDEVLKILSDYKDIDWEEFLLDWVF